MKIRIAARRSDLARLQAYQVGDELKSVHPALEPEYYFKESLGDQNQHDPLWKLPAQGVFTEDFVADLLEGRADLVVHSWKDLPTAARTGLALAATLPRADPRDLLLLRKDLEKSRLTLLTSSPRRAFSANAFLAGLLPFPTESIATRPVRGNILTRLKKLALGEGDGLFIAKAALDRMLGSTQEEFASTRKEIRALLAEFRWMVLPLSLFPTAPAQGALAIEIKAGRQDLRALLAPLHHAETAACVEQERSRFAAFGGGCHQKIGITVLPHRRFGKIEFFHGHPEGREPLRRFSFERAPLPAPPGVPHWPEGPVFLRRSLAGVKNPGGALFATRADAIPQSWNIEPNQPIWTAGTRTWRKLARRGIWVCGSSDSLGEAMPEIQALLGESPSWTKLTHADSRNDAVFRCLATYRLEELPTSPPPPADAYFWPSESLFRWALARCPEIRGARHAAGAGFTAEGIEKELGRSIDVYYNYSHWRTGHAED
jgi:hydroxymethylbilane synthase